MLYIKILKHSTHPANKTYVTMQKTSVFRAPSTKQLFASATKNFPGCNLDARIRQRSEITAPYLGMSKTNSTWELSTGVSFTNTAGCSTLPSYCSRTKALIHQITDALLDLGNEQDYCIHKKRTYRSLAVERLCGVQLA